jgi:hypothetical protein
MPRNHKPNSNGSRKPSSDGSHKPGSNGTAIATVAPPALPTISRTDANKLLKQRAQELYHDARAQREERIRQFETEYGSADRIDHTLLRDLQQLQARFAAIGARQFKCGSETEPKVSKFTKQLGDIIGELSSHLATERALELFAPVEERDYVGMGGTIGRKGPRRSGPCGLQRDRRPPRAEERNADADPLIPLDPTLFPDCLWQGERPAWAPTAFTSRNSARFGTSARIVAAVHGPIP